MKKKKKNSLKTHIFITGCLTAAMLFAPIQKVQAVDYTVGAGSGANHYATLEALRQAVGTGWLTGDTITFNGNDNSLADTLDFGGANVTLQGSGIITTNLNNTDKRFIINDTGTTTIQGSNLFFEGNNTGGGISSNTVNVSNSILSLFKITSGDGGAIYNSGGTGIQFFGNIFHQNSAQNAGGAIYNDNGQITITNSDFSDNYLDKYETGTFSSVISSGGAINNTGNNASLTVNNADFIYNYINLNSSGTKTSSAQGTEAYGGAIFNFTVTIANTITDSRFVGNNIIVRSDATDNFIIAAGGAIANETGILNISDSEFDGNTVTGSYSGIFNPAVGLSDVSVGGGAIYNQGTMQIENTIFMHNGSAIFDASAGQIAGGTIHNGENGTIDFINTIFSNNAISVETANNAYVYGGVIFNENNMSIDSSLITNNIIWVDASTEVYGGAISNEGVAAAGSLAIVDTNFINNKMLSMVDDSPTGYGGAIDNYGGNVTIAASTKNVIFDGNEAAVGSDIFNEYDPSLAGQSIINLIADAGKTITFNGTINGNDTNDVSSLGAADNQIINLSGSGTTIFNNIVENQTINLNNGTLWLKGDNITATTDSTLGLTYKNPFGNDVFSALSGIGATNTLNIGASATFNTQNGYSDLVSLKEFSSNGGNWILDYDYYDIQQGLEKSPDVVVYDTLGDGDGLGGNSINITSINIMNEITEVSGAMAIIVGNGANTIAVPNADPLNQNELTGVATYTNSDKFTFYVNNITPDYLMLGHNKIAGAGGLAAAVQDTVNTSRTFSVTGRGYTETQDLNVMGVAGSTLSIYGNNRPINGGGNQGMSIDTGQTVNVQDVSNFSNFKTTDPLSGGIFTNFEGTLNITDTNFSNNSGTIAGVIANDNGIVNINAISQNVIFNNNTANGASNDINTRGSSSSEVNFNTNYGRTITIKGGIAGEGYLNKNGAGTLALGGDNSNMTTMFDMNDGTLQILANSKYFSPNSMTTMANNTTLSLLNGSVGNFNFGGGTLKIPTGSTMNLRLDVDLAKSKADSINVADPALFTGGGNILITNINLLSDAMALTTTINNIIGPNIQAGAAKIGLANSARVITTPIYTYTLDYTRNDGSGFDALTFHRIGGEEPSYPDYNPAIFAGAVAQQALYVQWLDIYQQAFTPMDHYMLMTSAQRQAMKNQNKLAAADGNLAYDPAITPFNSRSMWFKPYAAFENIHLKNGPRVGNNLYGSLIGGETEITELGNGWDGVFQLYAGYNGSHQTYDGVSIYQNGGVLGATGMLYKGNFFTGLTANVGASAAEAHNMYGHENFTMLATGAAWKSGYNWELADGKFIIQPNYMMSYTFVNTFDYNNSAGIRLQSDPLNAITIEPGIRFIGNLKNGWQPYVGVSMVWNIIDKTKFQANDVSLPDLAVRPFVRYGVGVRKLWGERYSGFLQAFMTGGGRNGIGLQAGWQWRF